MSLNSKALWQDAIRHATDLRHQLHQSPELGWQERSTAQLIRQELDRLGIEWRPCADTGTVATLASSAEGEHIALRADIDALPIVERSGVAWASQHEGCMHACGHDGHTATLLATAAWLKACETELKGPVTLLFQPAEEGGHGAQKMIQGGALDGVDVVFGWHNWPAIPLGKAVCPDGSVMAGNGTFHIEVQGLGGHASQPELCRDPVLAAAAITVNLQQLVSRRVAPQKAVVVSVTSIDAASGETIIPDRAKLAGSIRLADTRMRDEVETLISDIAEKTAASYGVSAEVVHYPRYGATVNHPAAAERYREVLQQDLGDGWMDDNTHIPIMASEDFSYYLDTVPGAFALIGSGEDNSENPPCHSPHYDFNDALIERVCTAYLRLVGAPLPT
ncbi:hippurate hydrolase [gamma proteobacterium HTCC5015]|nr:hippurate hydrolase [gamma proteobacterium HTCC5015]